MRDHPCGEYQSARVPEPTRLTGGSPRSPNDPDINLVATDKNWAAPDGLGADFDAVSEQLEGSLDKADQA